MIPFSSREFSTHPEVSSVQNDSPAEAAGLERGDFELYSSDHCPFLYLSTEGKWSLSDNSTLLIGLQAPVGPRGTEFGGLSVSGGTAPYSAEPAMLYLQLRRYF